MKELFQKVQKLSEIKRKNEEAVPMEVLTTKYRVPYETLCEELRTAQQDLRMSYMESIRIVSDIAAASVYMDLSDQGDWSSLLLLCKEKSDCETLLTKELIKAFVITINKYARG